MPTAPHTPPTALAPGAVVRPLSAEDLSILQLESPTTAGHTCKVILLDEPIDPQRLRAEVARRLSQAPGLCLRLSEVDGAACWAADPALDLDAHVVACQAGAPPDTAGMRALVADLFAQQLERSRPLWRMDVVPELADGGSAVIWRIHHALADGSTAMRMAGSVLWDEEQDPGAPDQRRMRPPAAPTKGQGRAPTAIREAPRPWRRSPFDGRIGAHRSVAFAQVELDGLRRVAAGVDGATVNDAILTVVAGGLRRWLQANHRRLGPVRVKVPVSLHGTPAGSGEDPANRDSFFFLDLPLDTPDPFARLAHIRRATRLRKQSHDAERLDTLMAGLGRASPRLRRFAERVLAHPRSFALNVSNVPGPPRPVRVLGISVGALYSLAEIRERHALRVAVVSLAGTLGCGLCADATLLPDVERLADGIHAESELLLGDSPS